MKTVTDADGNTWTADAFVQYLNTSLIPDLHESGMHATAEDFETAVKFIMSDSDEPNTIDLTAMAAFGIDVKTYFDLPETVQRALFRAFPGPQTTITYES